MAEPLVHEMLTSPKTRQDAREIVDSFLMGLPENMPLYALLTALASTFVGLCDDNDIDAEPAFGQITGTLARDPESFGARETVSSDMLHLYL